MVIEFYQHKGHPEKGKPGNPHKYIEVHADGYGHYAIREIINNRVRNYVGDGKLHRHSKQTLAEILDDYTPTWDITITANCRCCGKAIKYSIFGEEYDNLCEYIHNFDGFRSTILIQDAVPSAPACIRQTIQENLRNRMSVDSECSVYSCPRCSR